MVNISIPLNEGQKGAVDLIDAFLHSSDKNVFVLTGSPGTGKTYMTKAVLEQYDSHKIFCGAVSHAAKSVLAKAIDYEFRTYTIAQLLGTKMEINLETGEFESILPKNNRAKLPIIKNGILLLDEVSMVDSIMHYNILEYLKAYNIKCIAIGDPFQLPPVEHALEDSLFFKHIDFSLTESMRFNESIRKLSEIYYREIKSFNEEGLINPWALNEHTQREDGEDYKFFNDIYGFIEQAAYEIKTHPDNPNYARVLAFKIKSINLINAEIRRLIFGEHTKQFEQGEILISAGGYAPFNEQIIHNGQVLVVEDFEPVDKHPFDLDVVKIQFKGMDHTELPPIYTLKNTEEAHKNYYKMKVKYHRLAKIGSIDDVHIYERFLKSIGWFQYGYSSTIYKAQGSTLQQTYVTEGEVMRVKMLDWKTKFQALYVAITRGKDKVFIHNKDY